MKAHWSLILKGNMQEAKDFSQYDPKKEMRGNNFRIMQRRSKKGGSSVRKARFDLNHVIFSQNADYAITMFRMGIFDKWILLEKEMFVKTNGTLGISEGEANVLLDDVKKWEALHASSTRKH